jgi:alkylhydroperoxidase family enzyme
MRLSAPRVTPLDERDWTDEARELLDRTAESGRVYNIFRTLARYPKLLKRWMPFANHVLFKSSLPPREREMLILRIGWLCQAEYEFAQHVVIARRAGLADADIQRIVDGPDAPGWAPFDAALVRAADELHRDAFVSDATWRALAARYDTAQLMDVVFTVGQYNLISMALNSLGVPLDFGLEGFGRWRRP